MPLDANALGQQQWYDRLKGALTLQPYLNPMQPVDMAKGLWNSLVQYPHDVYTGQQQATPEGATKFALSTFSGGPGMAVKGAVGSAGGRLGAEAMGAAQPAQPWFSALAKGVEAAPVNKASGEQWLGTLKNMPGIKPEELQWTGFQKFLEDKSLLAQLGDRSSATVTKQEALDFLNQNQVNLQEVVKGHPKPGSDESAWNRAKEWYEVTVAPGKRFEDLPVNERAGWIGYIKKTEIPNPTKFSQYQLPGGENYRELLLTLPKDNASTLVHQRMTQIERVLQNPGDYDTSELNALRTEYRDLATKERNSNQFYSGHYDEPNILAHVRFNDRVDAAGKKTLFLEEVQSDWHQKGRKAGYQGVDKATDESVARHGSLVPNAPFKTTWPELALKRMVKYAVDNGYYSVSWTPGKVQAERYDLSKQISRVTYDENQGRLAAWGKDDNKVMDQRGITPEQLADHIGKEAADKLMAQKTSSLKAEPHKDKWGVIRVNPDGSETPLHLLPTREQAEKVVSNYKSSERTLSGVDLQVGGEGMNAFYDKMLPAAANKLGKRYGAKVGVTQMRADTLPEWSKSKPHTIEAWTLPITDAMRKEVGAKGQPLFTGGTPLGAAAMGKQQQMSPDQMRAYLMGNQS